MQNENEKNQATGNDADKAAANRVANIQEDNQVRPFDKIEGQMNNGETGGTNNDAQTGVKQQ